MTALLACDSTPAFAAIDRDAFWAAVDRRGPDECWVWTAGHNGERYGRLRVLGKAFFAHRVSYEWAHGPIPAGFHVCHHCDTPPCVNPAHLFAATSAENIRDAAKKGRMLQRVTPEQVTEMRAMFAAGQSIADIRRRFEVSRGCVRGHVRDMESPVRRFRWRAA